MARGWVNSTGGSGCCSERCWCSGSGRDSTYPFSTIYFHNVVGIPLSLVGAGLASLAAELAPVERRGTYLALFGCCFGAGYGISPIAAGLLLDAGLPEIIWTIQLAAAALAVLSLFVSKRLAGRPAG